MRKHNNSKGRRLSMERLRFELSLLFAATWPLLCIGLVLFVMLFADAIDKFFYELLRSLWLK